MAEHSEHPTEGAGEPGDRTNPVGGPHPPATPGDRAEAASEQPAAPADRPVAPAAYASGGGGDTIEGGRGPAARTARFRRWSGNNAVRMGGLALVAGLVGGLVGGGVVAAFGDDGGHDRVGPVRFERGMPRGGPGFRAPRYWNPRGQWVQPDPRQPGQAPLPVPPTPVPSPRTTG